jgi:SAM-dependent methyltransferase
MKRTTGFRIAMAAVAIAVVAGVWMFGRTAAFHFLPLAWTGEADRLAAVLQVRPGMTLADIGAGNGRLAFELARRIGPEGRVLVTELDPGKRETLARRARDQGLAHVEVVTAHERDTGLPAASCDAAYMRNVLHHIDDHHGYAEAVARAMKPSGLFVVLDFAPGAMGFLASDHGVSPDSVRTAFLAAGFRLVEEEPAWGGRMYLLAFRSEGQGDEAERTVQ